MARDTENCCASGQLRGARERGGEREGTGSVEGEEGTCSWVGRTELEHEERKRPSAKGKREGQLTGVLPSNR